MLRHGAQSLGSRPSVELLDADAPPALAVVLRALFAHPTWVVPVSVLAATAGLYAIFALWRAWMNRLAVS